jgi:NADPH2:quinone reductase
MSRVLVLKDEVAKFAKYSEKPLSKGQVLIKQHLIGVNHEDIAILQKSKKEDKAQTFGFEGVGVIEDVIPSGIRKLAKGDRVCYFTNLPRASSEHVILPEHLVIKMYDEVDEGVGATIRKAMMAHTIIYQVYRMPQKSWIVVNGACGGVGHYLCQWAARLNLNVIALVGLEEKKAAASNFGCKYVLNWRTDNVVEEIMRITKGVGANCVVDCIGADFFDIGIRCLMYFGMYISTASLSGVITANSAQLQERSNFITSLNIWHYKSYDHFSILGGLEFFEAFNSYGIRPLIRKFSYKDTVKAIDTLAKGHNVGCNVVSLI